MAGYFTEQPWLGELFFCSSVTVHKTYNEQI